MKSIQVWGFAGWVPMPVHWVMAIFLMGTVGCLAVIKPLRSSCQTWPPG